MRHIAVAVIVAVILSGCRRSPADELNAAAGKLEYRPVEGRLCGLPYQPHLILTETKDDDGKLTAAEIAALDLHHIRTVVLAGCRTAAGTRSLVEAFLTAGAGSVVGTLWEVDDAATRDMSITFHRSLRDGARPAAALRATQIEMIRRAASPRVWASMQLYGSGS